MKQTWEHNVVAMKSSPSENEQLNALGTEGWELVTVIYANRNWYYYLKRPK